MILFKLNAFILCALKNLNTYLSKNKYYNNAYLVS